MDRCNQTVGGHAAKSSVSSLVGRVWVCLLLCSACLLPSASRLAAATYSVTNLSDSGPGTLRQAMNVAADSEGANVIFIDVTGTILLASSLPGVSRTLSVIGPGPASLTIDGSNQVRILGIFGAGTALQLSGLTLANGFASSEGGAVFLKGGDSETSLSLTNCVLRGNTAGEGNGGAISATGPATAGVLNLVDCTLSGNSA